MRIKKMIASQFMGFGNLEVDFSDETWIKGRNGSGKSTIATAILWVLSDYNYALNNNPMVEPIGYSESKPTVTLVCDVDGKEVTIRKEQTITVTYDEDVKKKSTNNRYYLNEVPVTQRDFKSRLMDYGIDVAKILPLMHPMFFVSQKPVEQKKVLFEMTTAKSDLDIALMSDETKELAECLKEYTIDEVSAMYKASKKKADEATKSIPEQIVGLQKAICEEDPKPLEARISAIDSEIKSLKEDYAKQDKSEEISALRAELFSTQREIADTERKLKDDESLFRRKAAENTLQKQRDVRDVEDVIYRNRRNQSTLEDNIKTMLSRKERFADEWRELKKKTYPAFTPPTPLTDSDMVCPTCGQALPEKLREQKKADYETRLKKMQKDYQNQKKLWTEQMQKEAARIKLGGQNACDGIREAESKMEDIGQQLLRLEEDLKLKKSLHEKAIEEESAPFVPDKAKTELLTKLKNREESISKKMHELSTLRMDTERFNVTIGKLQEEQTSLKKQLGVIENNENIQKKIEYLENERMVQEQKKADAEMILQQLDILSRKKNDLLVEEINSHFKLVKFQLFEYQKNGNYKEICIPTIDGYRFRESTNTGREIIGKLDICQSLQRFYGVSLPIILDNAESINRDNIPLVESQLILLTVTGDEKLVIENG